MSIPDDVRSQFDTLVRGIEDVLGEQLVGVYLHGSLALGCFNPQRSDVDVLAVIWRPLTDDLRSRLEPILLSASGPKKRPRTPPYPLELSFLTQQQVRPWRYPTPYDTHFHESFRSFRDAKRGGHDYDLAAHFTIVRAAGVALHGPPPEEVFPEVPHPDFVDSLLRDLRACRETDRKLYSVLSASRIWATIVEGGLQSKATGAEWALERAPAEFRPLIQRALGVYRGELETDVDVEQANAYVDFVRSQLPGS